MTFGILLRSSIFSVSFRTILISRTPTTTRKTTRNSPSQEKCSGSMDCAILVSASPGEDVMVGIVVELAEEPAEDAAVKPAKKDAEEPADAAAELAEPIAEEFAKILNVFRLPSN